MSNSAGSPKPSRAATVQCQTLPDGSAILFDTATATAFPITESARLIWESCDGGRDLDGIVGVLLERYDVEAETARRDATALIDDLVEKGLLTLPDAA